MGYFSTVAVGIVRLVEDALRVEHEIGRNP